MCRPSAISTCALLATCLCNALPFAYPSAEGGSAEIELFRDPGFLHGVTQGYANCLPPAERADCLARWQARGIADAQWAFWEISERMYFAHNPYTPVVSGSAAFHWSTVDQAKQCIISDGAVHMLFDTSKEWREGGNLSLADPNGNRPKYGDPNTTWPHFLIGQHFAKTNDPLEQIEDSDKILFDQYARLRFTADVRLNRILRNSEWDHSPEYGCANHALFYIAFVVMPRSVSGIHQVGKIYILVPAIYSEGDNRHVQQCAPWLGLDQFGDSVYFSGSQPALKAGEWTHYSIDVKQLIREGLAAAAKEAIAQGSERSHRPEDYFLAVFLIGWEVWGGFDTDVEFRNLSLRGTRCAEATGGRGREIGGE
jgi:hypothetical protein